MHTTCVNENVVRIYVEAAKKKPTDKTWILNIKIYIYIEYTDRHTQHTHTYVYGKYVG